MDNNKLINQAREMITNLTSKNGNANDAERHATKRAIEAAYTQATTEEKTQLDELEQQLVDKDLLR